MPAYGVPFQDVVSLHPAAVNFRGAPIKIFWLIPMDDYEPALLANTDLIANMQPGSLESSV